jgi:hypothetical protein
MVCLLLLSAIDKYVKALKQALFCCVLPAQILHQSGCHCDMTKKLFPLYLNLHFLAASKQIHRADIDTAHHSLLRFTIFELAYIDASLKVISVLRKSSTDIWQH